MVEYQVKFSRAEWQSGEPQTIQKWKARWPNFEPGEIASRGNGDLLVNFAALDTLQRLRNSWRRPLVIYSAYRDPAYNEKVGGVKNSMHLQGRAFDIQMPRMGAVTRMSFIYHATKAGFTGFGMYEGFMHVDTSVPRCWEQGQTPFDLTYDSEEVLEHLL